jgi:DNA invertase Pin-like site-specific DNA recombinase
MNMTLTKAVAYLRISHDATGEGQGVERQREDARDLAARRGWELVAEHIDNDVSAAGGKKRPGFEAMLDDLVNRRAQVVIAWNMDRVTRNRRDTVRFIETAQEAGALLALVRGADLDLSTPGGRMVADLTASIARNEIEVKGDRQVRANAQRAAQGKPHIACGRRFGYSPDAMSIREDEAQAIREGFAAVVAGSSLGSITRRWNGAGLVTTQGNPWTPTTTRKVLTNPFYAALRQYRGEIVGAGVWPAIVAEDTYRAAQHILTNPARSTTADRTTKRLLASIATCGKCGEKMGGGYRQPGKKPAADAPRSEIVYRCKGHSCVVRSAPAIDAYVTEQVLWRLSQPDALALATKPVGIDVEAVRTQAAALRARMDEAASEFAEGNITAAQLRTITETLTAKLAAADEQLAEAGKRDAVVTIAGADDVTAAWAALDITAQRSIIRALFSSVTVEPIGRGQWRRTAASVAGSVTLQWRQP